MKSWQLFFTLSLCCCTAYGSVQTSCRIIDPDLSQGVYRGSCKDGLADGYGEVNVYAKHEVISSYRGDFLAGKKHGKGVKVMSNGDRYEGEFSNDYRDGRGVYVWGSKTPWAGDRYEGEYKRDLRHGWGIYQWSSGDKYEGAWENDLRMGPSVMELRRAQAAEAAATVVKPGAELCAEEKWDLFNIQLIRGKIENVAGKVAQVRVIEVEGGVAKYKGTTLTTGVLLADEAAHWQLCDQH